MLALPAAPGRDRGALRGRTHLHPTIEGVGPAPWAMIPPVLGRNVPPHPRGI